MREKGTVTGIKNGNAEVVVLRKVMSGRGCCGGVLTTEEVKFRIADEGAEVGEEVFVLSEDDKADFRRTAVMVVLTVAFLAGMGAGTALFSVLVPAVMSGAVVSIAAALVLYLFYRKQPLQKARIERKPVEATA
jgi:hypothetical protein